MALSQVKVDCTQNFDSGAPKLVLLVEQKGTSKRYYGSGRKGIDAIVEELPEDKTSLRFGEFWGLAL